ncbi:MAG: Flp pilus assembly protein CpaB, partial [Actinobacteria bacterium]|nr:Flp pilus assembly protein CpaB [Actinomycetota bacterium]
MVRLLILGIAMAVVAGVLTAILQARLGTVGPIRDVRATPRDVIVATRDVASGTVLADDDLAVETFPAGADARGAVSAEAAAIGRTLSISVRKGQMIREDDLAARGSGAAIAGELQPGFRAITVTLRDVGPGVVLFPGAFVDVIATVDGPVRGSNRTEAMSRTVVSRSLVLAVNNDTIGTPFIGDREGRGTTRRLSVTIAVTAAQAAQVELASARGSVGIALCSNQDPTSLASELVTTSNLLGIPMEAPERPEPKPAPKPAPSSETKPEPKPEPKP